MKVILDIDTNSKDAMALLNYIRSLQYVSILEDEPNELSSEQKAAIDKGLKSLEDGSLTHEEAMSSARLRFPHLFEKRA
ncbi:MAG: hypothetical protein KBF73_10640 [Flavobacteriales bacterium]|nr:hypothetical protein [Flavobacteriales bacterium]